MGTNNSNNSRRFEMLQSRRGHPTLRLCTLYPEKHRTRYVYAQSQEQAFDIAEQLVQEQRECLMETFTNQGWDPTSIFTLPQQPTDELESPDYDLSGFNSQGENE